MSQRRIIGVSLRTVGAVVAALALAAPPTSLLAQAPAPADIGPQTGDPAWTGRTVPRWPVDNGAPAYPYPYPYPPPYGYGGGQASQPSTGPSGNPCVDQGSTAMIEPSRPAAARRGPLVAMPSNDCADLPGRAQPQPYIGIDVQVSPQQDGGGGTTAGGSGGGSNGGGGGWGKPGWGDPGWGNGDAGGWRPPGGSAGHGPGSGGSGWAPRR
ncbi:hypothetical protein [Alsobacter sp. R-9]